MKKFTQLALIAAVAAGGYYLYKEIEKQKQLAEGETFDDDSDLFEDDFPVGDAADTDAEIEVTEDAEEAAPSRFANIKAKTSDVATKVKDKTKDIAAVVSEKASELKEYVKEKIEAAKENTEEAAEEVEEAAEDAVDEASDDWTGKLEDAEEKIEDIAGDMTDTADPE